MKNDIEYILVIGKIEEDDSTKDKSARIFGVGPLLSNKLKHRYKITYSI